MYDTIHFQLPAHLVDGGISPAVVEHVRGLLTEQEIRYDLITGEKGYKGKLKNLKVEISTKRLLVKGSLHKFVMGNQLTPMYLSHVKQGIQKLSELFRLPMEKAVVSRLDFALNIETLHPPKTYYPYFGEASRYTRRIIKNTLYYNQKNKQIAIYDKQLEMKKHAPKHLKHTHLLRFEIRYNKQVRKQLKWEVTGATLYDPSFYQRIVEAWEKAYQKIYKIHNFGGMEQVQSVKDLERLLLLDGIRKRGYNNLLKQLEQGKQVNQWDSQQRNRLKKKVKEIAETPHLTCTSPRIEELDRKVEELALAEYNKIQERMPNL